MHSHLRDIEQLTIVGTGLLGTSIGLGLKAAGYGGRIVGVGRRIETVHRACELGGVDDATTDLAKVLPTSQLVIVAVPLGGFAAVFEEIGRHDHERLFVTDVGSTKQSVLAHARQYLPQPRRFVGSHPMAGSEQQGPEAAHANLFQGKPCVITAEPDSDPRAVATVEALWTMLGMQLLRMSAEEHDAHAAVISHLPHVASVMLVEVAQALGGWEIASTGFRDTTRLASSNPPMRCDIMTNNRQQIVRAIDVYREALNQLRAILERGDDAALLEFLQRNKDAREQWMQGQHHGS